MSKQPPAGFKELPEGLGFTDVLRPLYRRAGDVPAMGMYVRPAHTNLLNICHGGVLMTLADVGAAWGIHHHLGKVSPAPSLNLGFDFIAAAREGDWLQAEVDRVTVKRRIGFSSGVITAGDTLICRFSGTFYRVDHKGFEADADRLFRMRIDA